MMRLFSRYSIKRFFLGIAVIGYCSTLIAVTPAATQPTYADCNSRFLTFPTWYDGLTDKNCNIKSPSDFKGGDGTNGLSVFIWKIALNVIDILLQLVGYISVGFIIYGGFRFMVPAGTDNVVQAKKTVFNAVIGLIVAVVSVAVVSLIGASL